VRTSTSSRGGNASFGSDMCEIVHCKRRPRGIFWTMGARRAMGSVGGGNRTGFLSRLDKFLFILVCNAGLMLALQFRLLLLVCILCVLEDID
jgi:hypothetical protein